MKQAYEEKPMAGFLAGFVQPLDEIADLIHSILRV